MSQWPIEWAKFPHHHYIDHCAIQNTTTHYSTKHRTLISLLCNVWRSEEFPGIYGIRTLREVVGGWYEMYFVWMSCLCERLKRQHSRRFGDWLSVCGTSLTS